MSDILVSGAVYQGTVQACITDLTPPTFAGIATVDVESRGQIRATWLTATDSTPPIRYEIYIQANTATGLFNTSNIVALTPNLQYDIFTLPDGSFLQNGTTYYVGVRAIDGVSNRDNNLVSLNVISTGILTAIDVYKTEGVFSVNESRQLTGNLWCLKNSETAVGVTLGTASYQVYDKTGNAIVGLSQSGITANSEGLFIITPVACTLNESFDHYTVKVVVNMDGEARDGFATIETSKPVYEIGGVPYLDNTNNLVGSFWVSSDERIVSSNLGTGSYEVFNPNGTSTGITQSGIVADVNGVYTISPVPLSIDPNAAYYIKVSLTVNGVLRSDYIVVNANARDYAVKGQFSINALNQFQGTLWATDHNLSVSTALLGTASYEVFDKDGLAVAGLSQTGITADVNGLFKITPVSAALLSDLTHYTVKITINIANANRIAYKGFTLLGA